MNGMASFGVASGGLGVLLIGWRVYETWSPALTERAVYVLGGVIAVVGLGFVAHLFALARERRKEQQEGWGGRAPRAVDGYGRPVYEQTAPAGMPAPIVVQHGSGRGARTEVIYAAPPPQYGPQYPAQAGWQPPVQVLQQGYGYGPPPSANYGPNGFGGGFPGYPQPGSGNDAGAFNDATGGNVF